MYIYIHIYVYVYTNIYIFMKHICMGLLEQIPPSAWAGKRLRASATSTSTRLNWATVKAPCNTPRGHEFVKSLRLSLCGTCPQHWALALTTLVYMAGWSAWWQSRGMGEGGGGGGGLPGAHSRQRASFLVREGREGRVASRCDSHDCTPRTPAPHVHPATRSM